MRANLSLPLLSQVRIATPCTARWEEMTGDARTRHCAQCDLDVHNISEMTEAQAEEFLFEKLGKGRRVCGRLFRRVDGTILTKDCPVGLARWRQRAWWAAGRVAAAMLFLATGGAYVWGKSLPGASPHPLGVRLSTSEPFRTAVAWLNRAAAPAAAAPQGIGGCVTMGDVALSPRDLKRMRTYFAQSLNDEARALMASGSYEAAAVKLHEAMLQDPMNEEGLSLRMALGELSGAAAAGGPEVRALLARGRELEAAGKIVDAVSALEGVLRLDPGNAAAQRRKAELNTLIQLMDSDAKYEKLFAKNP